MAGPPFVSQGHLTTVTWGATDSDDLWLKSHIEDIVERYAHKVIAILDQQIVGVGTSIAELQRTVAAHYPQRVPLIFEVPTREEFECLL